MEPATVVIDNGTGYSKMGYAGNMEPSYMMPSVIAMNVKKVSLNLLLTLAASWKINVNEFLQLGDGLLHWRRGTLTQLDARDPLHLEERPDLRLGGHRALLAQIYLLLPQVRARAAQVHPDRTSDEHARKP